MPEPVIIEAAINGSTTKARQPHVPTSREELVMDALACLGAGAAIIHNHIGLVGASGGAAADEYLAIWRDVLAERPDALWYPTVNIGPPAQWYDHVTPLAESGLLRMSLSDPGSVNLGGASADGVPTGSFVYANSFDDIAHQIELCHEFRLGPSIAIYEPGFLRVAGTLGNPKAQIDKTALAGTLLEKLGGRIPGVNETTGGLLQGLGGILSDSKAVATNQPPVANTNQPPTTNRPSLLDFLKKPKK